MPDSSVTVSQSGFKISQNAIQVLKPSNREVRFEGIAYSPSGNTLAVAASDRDTILFYRRQSDGRFEDQPYSFLSFDAGIKYPHDLSFTECDGYDLLAVAQRWSALTVFRRRHDADYFEREPVFEINGRKSRLNYSDGAAFVPPNSSHIAACNLRSNTVSFYEWTPGPSPTFKREPVFELKHESISSPDGLAFSSCGRWLAVANHGDQTVAIFERSAPGLPEYSAPPVVILSDESLQYPHSLCFIPDSDHLVVTNAGANYLSVYEPQNDVDKRTWNSSPVVKKVIGPDSFFKEINATNKMEGGPKGIACHDKNLAVCSPSHGVQIFSFDIA